jgi:HEAT repeat protein
VTRWALLAALLAASPGLRAQEAETPFLVFREPDPETEKEITRELITPKALGDHTPQRRREVRERLASEIGPWSVRFLGGALAGRKRHSSARIRMNAAITLAMLSDPRGLDALRRAATGDEDPWVRRAAALAVGPFRSPADVATLRGPKVDRRAAAPALAKLRHPDAVAILKAMAEYLPKDEHEGAAVLLAAAIATPDVALVPYLEGEKARLVQQAAATGLTLRPLPPRRAGELLAVFPRLAGPARVMAIRALGAIRERPDDVRALLLDIARRDGPAEERIAALLELDEGRAQDLDPLRKAYGKIEGRNEPIVAALLFAMARTGELAAADELLGVVRSGSDFLRFYAAASLLHAHGPREILDERIRVAVTGMKGSKGLEELAVLAQRLAATAPAARQAAFADLRKVEDPRNLRLFSFTREERNWREANRLLAQIFQLDEVLVQFDSARPGRKPESALGGAGGGEGAGEGRSAPSGTNEEQDLFDLLLPPVVPAPGDRPYPERPPYFGPGDLGAG